MSESFSYQKQESVLPQEAVNEAIRVHEARLKAAEGRRELLPQIKGLDLIGWTQEDFNAYAQTLPRVFCSAAAFNSMEFAGNKPDWIVGENVGHGRPVAFMRMENGHARIAIQAARGEPRNIPLDAVILRSIVSANTGLRSLRSTKAILEERELIGKVLSDPHHPSFGIPGVESIDEYLAALMVAVLQEHGKPPGMNERQAFTADLAARGGDAASAEVCLNIVERALKDAGWNLKTVDEQAALRRTRTLNIRA